jgi:hypothetical protein
MKFTDEDRAAIKKACHILKKLAAIAVSDLTRDTALKLKEDLEELDHLVFAVSDAVNEANHAS